jgi:hypothetical protein
VWPCSKIPSGLALFWETCQNLGLDPWETVWMDECGFDFRDEVKNTRGKITLSFTSPEKDFFLNIYDVIMKQKKNALYITTSLSYVFANISVNYSSRPFLCHQADFHYPSQGIRV